MDTSKDYIEMCGKAEEIQKLRGKKAGGSAISKYQKGDFRIHYGAVVVDGWFNDDGSDIWLPRQDQLFEMLIQHFKERGAIAKIEAFFTIRIFEDNTIVIEGQESALADSLEKIWLMNVMWKIYRKEWSSKTKEWVLSSIL